MTQATVKNTPRQKVRRRCVLYARVSTEEQTEGPSLDEQLNACRRYAAERGMIRVAEFAEDFTGKTLERPKFRQILAMLQSGKADALIVNYHDRLSRNYIDFLVLRDQLEQGGVELHYVDTGPSRTGFDGLMTETIYALLAHGERERIVDRCRVGKDGHARRGRAVMGLLPYGYDRDANKSLVIVPEEAKIVENMFYWYAYGDDNSGPYNIQEIVDELNRRQVSPPSPRSTKRLNQRWIDSTIYRILKSETYVGKVYWGKTRINDKGLRVKQPKGKWIVIPAPAIVDQKTFDICQKRFARNRQLSKRNRKFNYLLSGHIRCGNCGRSWAGKAANHSYGEYYYYRCTYIERKSDIKKPCKAKYRSVPCKVLDEAVSIWLMGLISDDESLKNGLNELERQAAAELLPKQERLKTVERLINKELDKIDRLVARIGDINDDIVAAAMEREIRQAAVNKDALLDEKIYLQVELQQTQINPETRDYMLSFVQKIRKRLKDATYENVRTLLDILDVRVTVSSNDKTGNCAATMTCVFPAGGVSIDLQQSKQLQSNRQLLIFSKTVPILYNKRRPGGRLVSSPRVDSVTL